jgi:2-succinyl-5-enolpyruvyl-6-hydroxy-3-cyclohexene-1-carboxylate synthase
MLELAANFPRNFGIFFGNGMPIRNADNYFFPKNCRAFYGNRGLSGIDGNIATIAGLAEHGPMIGFIGDQACLHDINSLPLLNKTKHPAILIVSNNFGGRIFEKLPIAHSPHADTLFINKHELTFENAAHMFNIRYAREFTFEQSCLIELNTLCSPVH